MIAKEYTHVMRRITGIAIVLAAIVSGVFILNTIIQAQAPPVVRTVSVGTASASFSASAPTTAERWLDCGGANARSRNAQGRCPYQGGGTQSDRFSHTICSGPWTYELNTPYKSGANQGGTAMVTMSGTRITVNTSGIKPGVSESWDTTISYTVAGTYDIWYRSSHDGFLLVGDDAECSVTKSVAVRVNGPSRSTADRLLIKRTSSNVVCGEGGCIDPGTDADGNPNGGVIPTATQARQRGDYVAPNPSRCTIVTRDGGTMSWCGTLTNAAGVTIAPNGVPLSEFTDVRRY